MFERGGKNRVKGIWEGMTFRKEYSFCILSTPGKNVNCLYIEKSARMERGE